jgi:hypothetical protein
MARKPSKKSSITLAADSGKNPAAARLLTSERIATDVDAFRAGGGKIEVLGITRVLTPSEEAVNSAKARGVAAAASRKATVAS